MLCAYIRSASSALILLVVLTVASNSQIKPTPTATPDDTVRVQTEEVKINVLAYDPNQRASTDVRLEDLVVTENNVIHQASSLRRLPANVVIVLDTGGELRQVKTIGQTRKTAAAFIAALQPADAVGRVEYSDSAAIIAELTTDRKRIAEVLSSTNFGLGSDFIAAVRLASGMLAAKGTENRHLVLITDGTDNAFSGTARERALRDLLKTDINVHVISYTALEIAAVDPLTKSVKNNPQPATEGPVGMPLEVAQMLPNGSRDFKTGPRVGPVISLDRTKQSTWKRRRADLESAEGQLRSLTENANGMIIIPATLEEMISKAPSMAEDIDRSYVLTYMPKVTLGEKHVDRYITVTSRRPDLVVHARRKLVLGKN